VESAELKVTFYSALFNFPLFQEDKMKVINIGTVDLTVEGNVIKAGQISDNIDDILARQIVAGSGGTLALAPESEHTPAELVHADEKPVVEEPVSDPMRLAHYYTAEQLEEKKKLESPEEPGSGAGPKKRA
jgi:hypothetical protein